MSSMGHSLPPFYNPLFVQGASLPCALTPHPPAPLAGIATAELLPCAVLVGCAYGTRYVCQCTPSLPPPCFPFFFFPTLGRRSGAGIYGEVFGSRL